MTEVRYLRQAREDVLDAVEFYESEAPGLGAEFLRTLVQLIDDLVATPQIGAPYSFGTRRTLLGRFPFSLVYEIGQDQLLIIAVAHHRRKPGYWKSQRAE